MEKSGMSLGVMGGGLALGAGLVLASYVATQGLVQIKSQDQTISVTGSAKRRLRSDLVIWSGSVTTRAPEVAAAYKQLAVNVPRVTDYLLKKGVAKGELVVSSISTKRILAHDKEGNEIPGSVTSYEMVQTLEVRSHEVDKITQISREVTELINDGVMLESDSPQYLYTKLGDLKIQMLAEAAKDAKIRADQIAASTGSHIGKLRSARMGVMQVNAADASEISDTGVNDTSSIDKDIMAVVTSSFALE